MRRAAAHRGFTLAEVLVYMALVTGSLVAIGGLALTAQQTLRLQQSLVDINVDATQFLSSLRRDVEAARRLDVEAARLTVHLPDGRRVVYAPEARTEYTAAGELRGTIHFPTLKGLTVASLASGVQVKLAMEAPGAERRDRVRRTFEGTAAPRLPQEPR